MLYCSFDVFNKTSSVFLISKNERASQKLVSNSIYRVYVALQETMKLTTNEVIWYFFLSTTDHLLYHYLHFLSALITENYPRLFVL